MIYRQNTKQNQDNHQNINVSKNYDIVEINGNNIKKKNQSQFLKLYYIRSFCVYLDRLQIRNVKLLISKELCIDSQYEPNSCHSFVN